MSIRVSTGLVKSVVRYCCLCMVVFYNLIIFAIQENIEQWYAILSGTNLSKRAEKMLKTTLVLEDQSRQQMIKMCKWCEV